VIGAAAAAQVRLLMSEGAAGRQRQDGRLPLQAGAGGRGSRVGGRCTGGVPVACSCRMGRRGGSVASCAPRHSSVLACGCWA